MKKNEQTNKSVWIADRENVLRDYRIGFESRQASLIGRREVLSGKAKFGIFGDGKEVPQLAMARAFELGDFRSGYYRDQTFMFAKEISTVRDFFAQLYAIADVDLEPASAGRSMNGHFGTRSLNADGSWKKLTELYNSSADVSPTGSQMPRLVGLAYASRLYKEVEALKQWSESSNFSRNGREIAFGTIGNASSAEGMFWESVDAIGTLKAPALISIWDDGYGISVPNEFQHTKGNVGELLEGFRRTENGTSGYDIYTVKAWDYPTIVETYKQAAAKIRETGYPAIIHVIEVTQPQGHSTSGSHERYKSEERLAWETEFDCLARMRTWMIAEGVATENEIDAIEKEAIESAKNQKQEAWELYLNPIKGEIEQVCSLMDAIVASSSNASAVLEIKNSLQSIREPFRADYFQAIHKVLLATRNDNRSLVQPLVAFRDAMNAIQEDRYSSYLHTPINGALSVPFVPAIIDDNAAKVNGSDVLNANFDYWFKNEPRLVAFGEDLGKLGDVNQGMIGLQEKYGALRVSDVGIRECTILGQAIGMAMRGLKPIAEMQYLDYILYALQLMSDDLATVQWRTKGGQKAPVIVRTRGHRLEGVWHSGSPMSGIINLVRGMHVCVPRDMTRAAGMYNTLLRSDDPAIIVEVLNGYRLKETVPTNVGEFTVPLGVPEVLRAGTDVTVVTYGATCRVVMKAAEMLAECGISIEVVDVQTLLPFDTHGAIAQSVSRTNRVLFVDEDVPGGATAFMLQNFLEQQNGYALLDSAPKTLTAKAHRPAYGTDGNYWSKPEAEHVFDAVYSMMHEAKPQTFPLFYK